MHSTSITVLVTRLILVSGSGCNLTDGRFGCQGQGLTEIPESPGQAKEVALGGNNFTILRRNTFSHFNKCIYLSVHRSYISEIESGAFKGLRKLLTLNLNANKITMVHKEMFVRIRKLMTLWLRYNKLTRLDSDSFENFPKLERLFLQDNMLTEIPGDMWKGLRSLKKNCIFLEIGSQLYIQDPSQSFML